MVARQNRRALKPACNDNGPVLILCRATPEPRSPILRVASLLAGVVSVSYVVEGVLLIAPGKTPVRSVPARVARAASAAEDALVNPTEQSICTAYSTCKLRRVSPYPDQSGAAGHW